MAQSETRQQRRTAQRAAAKKNPKRPTPTKVLLDGMPTVMGDDIEYFHIGEWLTVRPALTMGVVNITLELMARQFGGGFDLSDMDGKDPGEARQEINEVIEDRRESASLLSQVILEWNVTNCLDGKPLPQPVDANAFDELTVTEFAYLNAAVTRALNANKSVYDPEEEAEEEDPKESSSE